MKPKRRLRAFILCFATVFAVAPAAPATSAQAKPCKPVKNPYAGTRYEGVDLSRIRARNVSCRTAHRVARGAHRKALGMTPTPSGIRRFRWQRWRVTANLRGKRDRYIARARGGKHVRWRF